MSTNGATLGGMHAGANGKVKHGKGVIEVGYNFGPDGAGKSQNYKVEWNIFKSR